MMRLFLSILSAVFFITGCAGHFYREEGGRVQIYLRNSRASAVHFVSSLDGFEPHRILKTSSDTWRITLPKSVEFRYFYLVDGKIHLPDCLYREMDDFGSYNCLYKPDPSETGTDDKDG